MANFDPANLAVQTICPNNLVKVDDTGLPSVLVYIPKFKNSDVLTGGDDKTHPAFIVNGQEIPGFYYSKYQNCGNNGVGYSLPDKLPATSVTFDGSIQLCTAKGMGWHMGTAAEWAAIVLWCKKNGFLPYGNNGHGKDSRESMYRAKPLSYDAGKIGKVATGSGPLEWSHDKTVAGIWDMNGNIWERQGGIRLVWGELQILANNDAADPNNSQSAESACWKAINAADGSLVEPESKTTDAAGKTSGSTVKLDYVSSGGGWTYSTAITNVQNNNDLSTAFASVLCDGTIGDAAKALLRSLALLAEEGAEASEYENDAMYWNNGRNECVMYRGGAYFHNAGSGVFSSSCVAARGSTGASIGFRSAYIPELDQ